MQNVVNHLTRMQDGYICVAGLDLDSGRSLRALKKYVPWLRSREAGPDLNSGRHIRPQPHDRLSVRHLARHGGPFALGGVVDLGRVQSNGCPPMIEDCRVDLHQLRWQRQMAADEFWAHLVAAARPTLAAIVGPALTTSRPGFYTVAPGQGAASLGCLRVSGRPKLYLRPRPNRPPQIRLSFSDGAFNVDTGVTDQRLYTDDEQMTDPARVDALNRYLHQCGGDVILGVGLSRPFAASADQPPVHWLQVNAIYPAGTPLWGAPLDG